MGMSTRSKTGAGAAAAPAPPISKPRARAPRAKKAHAAPSRGGGAVGNAFPDALELLNDAGAFVKTADLFSADRPGLVLFTYPRANTPGCTAQACSLRDALPDLSTSGYSVFGLSYDKPKSQAGWRAKHNLGYNLLCDTLDTGLIKTLGAHKAPKGIKRSVFVVRKDADSGKLTVVLSQVGVSPKDTVPVVREYVEKNPCAPAGAAAKEKDDKERKGKAAEPDPDASKEQKKANGN